MASQDGRVRIAILGASGYTGAELLRILAHHPRAEIVAMTADRQAGKPIGAVFPHLARRNLPDLVAIAEVDWRKVDLVFCCLPHGTTQEVLAGLPKHLRILDLSADFRLADPASYAQWYGHAHRALELQREAIYGLTEVNRSGIANARLVAVPGCYPTGSLLPLVPLVKKAVIDADDIVIDAKSGVTGAGRGLKETSLFAEKVSFTPHLMPMNRGILSTIYVRYAKGAALADLRRVLEDAYAKEAFVRVLPEGSVPATHHVRGSNLCHIGLAQDRLSGRAILVSAIDNLVKGASGQAVQDMNVMLGIAETTGLEQEPLFP